MTINDILTPTFITPVLVAFIGFLVAVTSSLIAKEQKVSEFRQAWINEIRKDFARLLSKLNELSLDLKLNKTEIIDLKNKAKNLQNEKDILINEYESISKTTKISGQKSLQAKSLEISKKIDEANEIKKEQDEIDNSINTILNEVKRIKLEIHKLDELSKLIILKLNPVNDQKTISKIKITISKIKRTSSIDTKAELSTYLELIKKEVRSLEDDVHLILKTEWEIVKRGEKKFLIWITIGEFVLGTMIIAFYVILALVKFPEYFPGMR